MHSFLIVCSKLGFINGRESLLYDGRLCWDNIHGDVYAVAHSFELAVWLYVCMLSYRGFYTQI